MEAISSSLTSTEAVEEEVKVHVDAKAASMEAISSSLTSSATVEEDR